MSLAYSPPAAKYRLCHLIEKNLRTVRTHLAQLLLSDSDLPLAVPNSNFQSGPRPISKKSETLIEAVWSGSTR
jgi:hypothetical protein